MIQIDHVSVSFGGLRAVDDVSFEIAKGRITGLIGPNGAGKTTLFNLVAGHVSATAGRVLLEGEDITRLKPHERAAKGLARTFQIPHEFGRLTVLENFMAAAAAPAGENVFNVMFRRGRFAAEEKRIYESARDTIAFLELERVTEVGVKRRSHRAVPRDIDECRWHRGIERGHVVVKH